MFVGCGGSPESTQSPGAGASKVEQSSATANESSAAPAPAADPGSAKVGGSMVIAASTDCSNVAAWRVRSPYEKLSWSGIYEPLFRITTDGEVYGHLAEKLESDYDNLTYTVHLRKDVYFSDGSHLDADVLLWNFENFLENSQSASTFFSRVKVFEKIDDYTVAIRLNEWTTQMPYSLADTAGLMYSKKAFDENGYDWCMENPVGTGPFVLDEWVTDEYKRLVRNDNYWNKEATIYLDSVEIKVIPNQTVAENALKTGEIDGYFGGTAAFRHNMGAQGFAQYANPARQTGQFLVFASAVEGSPMSDVRVRQAICYAIDSQTICDTLGYGINTYSGQYATVDSPFYADNVESYIYDPEKARQLLAEAGYADGFSTTLYTGNEMNLNDYMVALQAYLADVGINLDLQYADNAEWSGTIMYEIPDGMILSNHSFDNNIINQAFSNFASVDGRGVGLLHRSKIHPQELTDHLLAALGTQSTSEMMKHWYEANKLIFDTYCIAYTIGHTSAVQIVCNDRIVDMGWMVTACNYMDYTAVAVND